MVEKQITNKQDLIKILQQIRMKKIQAKDIGNDEDLNQMIRDAKQLLRSNHDVSLILIAS